MASSIFDQWLPEGHVPPEPETTRPVRQVSPRPVPRSRPDPTRRLPGRQPRSSNDEFTEPRIQQQQHWHFPPIHPTSRPPRTDMVAARHEESVLFSIADLQVLEVQRRQEQAARAVESRRPRRPRLVVDHPPPQPLVQGEPLPRNRSFWPVLLVTGLVLFGGVAAAVIAIARNTEVLTVPEPTPRATGAPVAAPMTAVPPVEKLAPAPARPVQTRLAQPRTEPRPHRAVSSTKARSRRKAVVRRRVRRRRAAARRRRSRRRTRRHVAAVAKPAVAKPTPLPPAQKKPLPTIDELISGGVR